MSNEEVKNCDHGQSSGGIPRNFGNSRVGHSHGQHATHNPCTVVLSNTIRDRASIGLEQLTSVAVFLRFSFKERWSFYPCLSRTNKSGIPISSTHFLTLFLMTRSSHRFERTPPPSTLQQEQIVAGHDGGVWISEGDLIHERDQV